MNASTPTAKPPRGMRSWLTAPFKLITSPLKQIVRSAVREEIQTILFPKVDQLGHFSREIASRIAIPVGPNELMMACPSGYVLLPADDIAVVACFATGGDMEPGTRIFLGNALQPGDTFVDVGANLGIMTLAAARAIGPTGKIFAFEPFPQTKRLLERTVWANGLADIVTIHQAAVSNKGGTAEFFIGPTCGHNSLFPLEETHLAEAAVSGSGGKVQVKMVRLDETIPAGTSIRLIKIDAEGAELEVLESAAALIRAQPEISLVVEFGPTHLKRRGLTTNDWLKPFLDLGLDYRAINLQTGALEKTTPAQLEKVFSENLFFSRPGSEIWRRVVGN